MIDFAGKVLAYTDGLDQAGFVASGLTYDATLRNLELIGEAATHIPDKVRAAHPEIPWRMIIAFLQSECVDSVEDHNRGGNGRKLEIRVFPSRNIHAKVYIGRFAPDDRDYGFVVTGSSNFSYS